MWSSSRSRAEISPGRTRGLLALARSRHLSPRSARPRWVTLCRVNVRSTAPPARTTPPPTRALVPAAEFPSGLRLHGPAVPPAVSPPVSPATLPAPAWAHRLPGGSGAGSGISPARRVLTHGNRRAGQPPVPAPHGTGHPAAPATRPSGTVPSRARCPAVPPVPRPGLPHAGGYGTVVYGPHAGGKGVQGSPGTASVTRCSPPRIPGPPQLHQHSHIPVPKPLHTPALAQLCGMSARYPTAPHVPWAPQCSSMSCEHPTTPLHPRAPLSPHIPWASRCKPKSPVHSPAPSDHPATPLPPLVTPLHPHLL